LKIYYGKMHYNQWRGLFEDNSKFKSTIEIRGAKRMCFCLIIARFVKHAVIEEGGFTDLHHPLYSPDLAPCDFFLFKKLKKIY
jgi:hypothetical protein